MLKMGVGRLGFMVDRLGQDCHPLQQIRELTQNAIEAILAAKVPGQVIWDMDYELHREESLRKLCVIDTGVGMTGDEMLRYINNLSSSGRRQAMNANYGMGAKIAAATRNPFGVTYASWMKGNGELIQVYRDDKEEEYGLRQFYVDEEYTHVLPIGDNAKPTSIQEHGTKVTLWGFSEEDDTLRAPESAPKSNNWLVKYLNTRYFRFPKNVTVIASELWNTPSYRRREVKGQEWYLNENKEASGSVELTGGTAYWWILKENVGHTAHGRFATWGHVAALYQNELYELTQHGTPSIVRINQFGVPFGYQRVVIYVEPDGLALTTNTARTQLLIKNEAPPWETWAAEFTSKLPDTLKAFIDQQWAKHAAESDSKSIRERLRKYSRLYQMTRYMPNPEGTAAADPLSPAVEPSLTISDLFPPDTGVEGDPPPKPSKRDHTAVLLRFQKKNGKKSNPGETDKYPTVVWQTRADGTREGHDGLEDRAARWNPVGNVIYANADWRVYEDMVRILMDEIKRSDNRSEELVRTHVHSWFEQALIEIVIGVQALSGSKYWSRKDIEDALSEKALSAAMMQKYHLFIAVKRDIGGLAERTKKG